MIEILLGRRRTGTVLGLLWICGIILWLTIAAEKPPAVTAALGGLGGALLLVSTFGLYLYWWSRIEGGVKGWRIGLLLLPVVGSLWSLAEAILIPSGLGHRHALNNQVVCAILLFIAGLIAVVISVLAFAAGSILLVTNLNLTSWTEGLSFFYGAVIVWAVFFGSAAIKLSAQAATLPVQPSSPSRRWRQLLAVLAVGWGIPLILAGAWQGRSWHTVRQLSEEISAAGIDLGQRPATLPENYREQAAQLLAQFYEGEGEGTPAPRPDFSNCYRETDAAIESWRNASEAIQPQLRLATTWLNRLPAADDSDSVLSLHLCCARETVADAWLALHRGDAGAVLERLEEAWRLKGGLGGKLYSADFLGMLITTGQLESFDDPDLDRLRTALDVWEEELQSEAADRLEQAIVRVAVFSPAQLAERYQLQNDLRTSLWWPWNRTVQGVVLDDLWEKLLDLKSGDGSGIIFWIPEIPHNYAGIWNQERNEYVMAWSILVKVNLLRVLAAAETYRRETGELPADGGSLVPRWLPEEPVDRGNGGAAFRFTPERRINESFVENIRDRGGEVRLRIYGIHMDTGAIRNHLIDDRYGYNPPHNQCWALPLEIAEVER